MESKSQEESNTLNGVSGSRLYTLQLTDCLGMLTHCVQGAGGPGHGPGLPSCRDPGTKPHLEPRWQEAGQRGRQAGADGRGQEPRGELSLYGQEQVR